MGRARRQAWALLPLAFVLLAMMPMTPRLDQAGRAALTALLGNVGMDEIAASSVLIALSTVLGDGSQPGETQYLVAAAHLPDIDAEARPQGDGCSEASLVATTKSRDRQLAFSGRFCRTDATGDYVWTMRSGQVSGHY